MKRKGSTLFSIGWALALSGMIWACAGTDFAGSTKATAGKKDKAGNPGKGTGKADNDDTPDDDDDGKKNPGKGTEGGSPSKATDNGTSGGNPSKGTGSGNPGKGTDNATTGAGTSTDKSTTGTGVNTDSATTGAGGDTDKATKGGTPGKAGTDVDDTGDTSTDGSGSEDPGDLTNDDGGKEKVLTSDLTISTDLDDDCGDGKVNMKIESYYNGTPYLTQTLKCPEKGQPATIPGACRTDVPTCLKITYTNGGDTQDTWGNQLGCVEIEGNTVYVDTNGAGFLGGCLGRNDESNTFSCANSPKGLSLANCL